MEKCQGSHCRLPSERFSSLSGHFGSILTHSHISSSSMLFSFCSRQSVLPYVALPFGALGLLYAQGVHVVGYSDNLLLKDQSFPVRVSQHTTDSADSAKLWLDPQFEEAIFGPIPQIGVPGPNARPELVQDFPASRQTSDPSFSCLGPEEALDSCLHEGLGSHACLLLGCVIYPLSLQNVEIQHSGCMGYSMHLISKPRLPVAW